MEGKGKYKKASVILTLMALLGTVGAIIVQSEKGKVVEPEVVVEKPEGKDKKEEPHIYKGDGFYDYLEEAPIGKGKKAALGEEPGQAGEETKQVGEEPSQSGEKSGQIGEELSQVGEEPGQVGEEASQVGEETAPDIPVILEVDVEKKGFTTDALNLREGAGTGYGIIQVIPKGTNLEIFKEQGEWLKVVAGGSVGWVHQDYVTEGAAPLPKEDIAITNTDFVQTLSSITTYYYDSTLERASNVELAASKINGLILQPGEVYSFTSLVSPVTAANGYQMATVFSGGTRIDGIGGGICQLSSTIYYAQLKAGIMSLERHAHSNAVSYVPLGLDATMWEGSLDHRFRNPFDVPIKIDVSAQGGVLTVQLKATQNVNDGYSYDPYTVKISTNGNTETWDTYLRVTFGGNVVEERYLHRSTYIMY